MKNNMEFIESKGDIHFYKDANGKLYQQLGCADIFAVANGKIKYRHVSKKNGVTIKYQSNGCNGFSLFKGSKLLEDNIWIYAEAERVANTL